MNDVAVKQIFHVRFLCGVAAYNTPDHTLAYLHFQRCPGKVDFSGLTVFQIGFLVAGHEVILKMPRVFRCKMGHIHEERGAVALQRFLKGPHDLVAAQAVFQHGIILAHETFAPGVQLMPAHVVDAVHARRAPALGQHGGHVGNVEIQYGRPRLQRQHNLTAGHERGKPLIERLMRRIVGHALRGKPHAQYDRLAAYGDDIALEYVKSHAPGDAVPVFE